MALTLDELSGGRLILGLGSGFSGSPQAIGSRLREIGNAGIDHMTFYFGDADDDQVYPVLTRRALEKLVPVLSEIHT